MILHDSHTHNDFSTDSHSPMKDMIEGAIKLELDSICITDHMDYDFPKQYNLPFVYDPVLQHQAVMRNKELYEKQIEVRFGVEVGLKNKQLVKEMNHNLIADYSFDFVIGSVHVVDDMDPYNREYWDMFATQEEAIHHYYQEALHAMQCCQEFDSLGHLDYITRYAPVKDESINCENYKEDILPVLQYLIENNKSLEVNTAGYKQGTHNPNPCTTILRWYRELGGMNITIGSDAHAPEYLAYEFEQLERALIETGFRQYNVYRKRKPVLYDI